MLDYMELEVLLLDNSLLLDNLNRVSRGNGWVSYRIQIGYSPLEVRYYTDKKLIIIKGSLPYFYQGHNLFFSLEDTKGAIEVLEELLGIGLYSAKVKVFEYGCIVYPDIGIDQVFNTHKGINGYKEQSFKDSKGKVTSCYYGDKKTIELKMYSVWDNLKGSRKISAATRLKLKDKGYSKERDAIKLELHCGSPLLLMRDKLMITVEDLFTDEFQWVCKRKLLEEYLKVNKEGVIPYSTKKKDLDVIGILMHALQEEVPDFERKIKNKLRDIPSTILSKVDKDSRRRVLNDRIKRLNRSCPTWSLEGLIREQLGL